MRLLPAVLAVTLALPALAAPRRPAAHGRDSEPTVVMAVGKLVVLDDAERDLLRGRLERARRLTEEAGQLARKSAVRDSIGNLANRIANARELLGFAKPERHAVVLPREGHEENARLADAVLSQRLIVSDFETVRREIDRAARNLEEARERAESPNVQRVLAEVREQLRAVRLILEDVSEARPARPVPPPPPVAVPGPVPPPPLGNPPPVPAGPVAMDDASFRALLGAMDRESFADARLRVVDSAARTNFFLVAQVQQVLARLPFSNQKLQAVELLRGRILDRQNSFRLYGSFQFESEKKQLERALSADAVPVSLPPAPQPIEPVALQALLGRLRAMPYSEAWFRVLGDEAPRSWFLVDQVADLAGSFPTSDGRMRAIKILRGRILDPQNSARLEPLFGSAAERQRLRDQFAR